MSKMSFSFSLNVILYMSKMSKIDQMHLRAVMLYISKMGKKHTHTFFHRVCDMLKVFGDVILIIFECNTIYVKDRSNTPKGCNAMYVKDGKRTYTYILIFNRLSIHKKFWKAETKSFPTIPSNTVYMKACRRCRR